MITFCYSLNIDGVDQPMQSREAPDEAAGIAAGREILHEALKAMPTSAYCAVFEDIGTDDEPLGAWSVDAEAGDVRWEPDD
jgi:hypothetical protein